MKKILVVLLAATAGLVVYYWLFHGKAHMPAGSNAGLSNRPDFLLVKAEGKVRVSNDLVILRAPGNEIEYILDGPLTKKIVEYKDRNVQVIGKGIPINPVTINSKPISTKIWVVVFGKNIIPTGASPMNAAVLRAFEQIVGERRALRQEFTKKFKKDGVFNLVKGRLSKETREAFGKTAEHITLTTDEGDMYLLNGPALKVLQDKFSAISSGPVVILGMEALPDKEHVLRSGEITFKAEEVYTGSLDVIK